MLRSHGGVAKFPAKINRFCGVISFISSNTCKDKQNKKDQTRGIKKEKEAERTAISTK